MLSQETKAPEQSEELTIFAPAKINLHLVVKNRREDGFHNLESLFLALNFGDLLHFKAMDTISDEIIMGNNDIPMLDNIIYKAMSLFREKTSFSRRFKVIVEKHIPIGGGLGGGSSNAAASLLALNKIASNLTGIAPLNLQALLEMAAALGSDVPFFIHETPAAWVSGRGELIEPIDILPPMFLVLINPGFPSDTARAFRILDEKKESGIINHEWNLRFLHKPHEPVLRGISSTLFMGNNIFNLPFYNDFLNIFSEEEQRIYNEIISALQSEGAQYANLSGSGATCFGVFYEEEQAKKAAAHLHEKWEFIQLCRSQCSPN